MRCLICFGLLLSAIAPTCLLAGPVPERKSAKPAVIDAKTDRHVQWLQERLVSCAHIAIIHDKKVAELPIVRRHLRDPKDTKELIPWLEKNFRLERVPDKKLIRVSFRDGTPEEQAAIINCVVDDFLLERVSSRRNSTMYTLKMSHASLAQREAQGKITAEQLAKAKEGLKKDEEYIQALPALLEKAKVR